MVKEIYFHNGRRTWGVNTTEVIKALEKQFGSKVKTIGGKPFKHRSSTPAKAKAPDPDPKRNLSRDRMFVSNEKHELAYIKKHPNSGRTGYKGVKKAKRGMHVVGTKDEYDQVIPAPIFKKGDKARFDGYGDGKVYTLPQPHWFAYMKEYSYKLPGHKEIALEYELTPIANPGLLIAMEMKKQKDEKDAKKQEFKDAHGGKEQWELDIPKEYQQAKYGAQLYNTTDKKAKFVRKKGNIITFKKEFFPRGTSEPGRTQVLVTGVEKSKGSVKLLGRAYDTPWYKSMDELIKAVDWKKMESWHKAENGTKTGSIEKPINKPIEYDTKQIKGHAKEHKKNTHFAFHKPSKSMVFSWDYKGYERDELYSYGGDDYFWTDVKDQVDYMVDKFRKQDFEIITRQGLSKKGYNLDDYKVFEGQKYAIINDTTKTPGKKEYLVMNNTDGITATQETFKTEKDAKKFITDFPKRYEAQGYYRNNKWEKMDPKDVELEIIQIDPNKLEFGTGGIILAGLIAGYVGYKVGRSRPQKKGFDTEKKIGQSIKRKAGETAQAYKERKQQKQNK